MRSRKLGIISSRRRVSLLDIAKTIAIELDSFNKDEIFAELVTLLYVDKRTLRQTIRMTICHLTLKSMESSLSVLSGHTTKPSDYHVYGAINVTLKMAQSRHWQQTMRRTAINGMGRNYTGLVAVAEADYYTDGHHSGVFSDGTPRLTNFKGYDDAVEVAELIELHGGFPSPFLDMTDEEILDVA